MSININGTDYALQDGDTDLGAAFNKVFVDKGAIDSAIYEANVVAYYELEGFRTFVQNAYSEGSDKNPQLMLVSFGGPSAISDLIKSARTAGVKGTRAGTKRTTSSWQTELIKALSGVGYAAMKEYYEEHKEKMWGDFKIPTEAQSDSFADMLINTGRGTLGCRVDQWEGVSPKTQDEGKYAINLNFRLDANNKGRAKRKDSNGVAESAEAAAPAK